MDRMTGLRGFSLTELLIVMAIVAILATVTVPSYSHYLVKTRRADAISTLLQLQLAQEQWRALHGAYSGSLYELGWQSDRSIDQFYTVRFEIAQPGHWLATARPVGVQSGDACALFAIDQAGPVYGGAYAGRRCWNR